MVTLLPKPTAGIQLTQHGLADTAAGSCDQRYEARRLWGLSSPRAAKRKAPSKKKLLLIQSKLRTWSEKGLGPGWQGCENRAWLEPDGRRQHRRQPTGGELLRGKKCYLQSENPKPSALSWATSLKFLPLSYQVLSFKKFPNKEPSMKQGKLGARLAGRGARLRSQNWPG